MTTQFNNRAPFDEPLNALLADIAIRIQLSRTAHGKAVQRYQTIAEHLDRDDSPLAGRVELVYPQGSMAIDAAIASGITQDEHDLDMVLQAGLRDLSPQQVLNTLFKSLNGQPGSRYHGKVKRRTRCVTVEYADMHIDVTPAERLPHTQERESTIFHHKHPQSPGQRVVANPFGFAEWFKQATPDTGFGERYAVRATAHEASLLVEAAEADPVPPQEPAQAKSLAVVALQLLKRWRNVQYQKRTGRRPPSVVLSKLVADAASGTGTLSEEMLRQAQAMCIFFERSHQAHKCVRVENPVCPRDVLTDRWPGSLADQEVFVKDLGRLVGRLEELNNCDLGEMRRIMVELFGEGPTADAIETFVERYGKVIRHRKGGHRRNGGRLVAPGAAAAGIATPQHKFYGGKWWK